MRLEQEKQEKFHLKVEASPFGIKELPKVIGSSPMGDFIPRIAKMSTGDTATTKAGKDLVTVKVDEVDPRVKVGDKIWLHYLGESSHIDMKKDSDQAPSSKKMKVVECDFCRNRYDRKKLLKETQGQHTCLTFGGTVSAAKKKI
jgi:hypothetical protein